MTIQSPRIDAATHIAAHVAALTEHTRTGTIHPAEVTAILSALLPTTGGLPDLLTALRSALRDGQDRPAAEAYLASAADIASTLTGIARNAANALRPIPTHPPTAPVTVTTTVEPVAVAPVRASAAGPEGEQDPRGDDDWHVTRSVRMRAEEMGVTISTILDTAAYPDVVLPDLAGKAMEHRKGGLRVLVPHDNPRCIIGVSSHVPAEDVDDSLRYTGRSGMPKAKSGGPGKSIPSSRVELLDALHRHGFATSNDNHPKVTHPDRPGKTHVIPGTPSDHRSYRNAIASIRREFGIDITS